MANSKKDWEKMVRDKMKGHSLVAAVFQQEEHYRKLEKKQADLEFKQIVKSKLREQQMEILNSLHPTICWINNRGIRCIIFAVTEDLKSDEIYFNRFLNACMSDIPPVLVGLRKTYLY